MKNLFYILILSCLFVFGFTAAVWADCSLTTVGITPLNDLGHNMYKGFQGGLYPRGTSARPALHTTAGISIAQNLQPLDAQGNPNPNGVVVMISVGMSNTTMEFSVFKQLADADPSKNPKLKIVDCAQGGMTTSKWIDPVNDPYGVWSVVYSRLNAATVTARQVQIAWFKEAEASPSTGFPAAALTLCDYLEQLTRVLKGQFPNLRLAYLSSRTRAYTLGDASKLNPEPYAYESGLSVKWLIEKQINATANLNYDPDKGTVVAPWLSWGPYLWADGTNPRSDGFTWLCQDVVSTDYTHPSTSGRNKVAMQLLAFFKTDPTAVPWFLKSTITGQPPSATAAANISDGNAPLEVHFTANGSDPDGTIAEYVWTFDDGGFSTLQNPTKTFYVPGVYQTHLTVIDNNGNAAKYTIPITINSAAAMLDSDINADYAVNLLDAAILASQWLQPPGVPSADISPQPGGDGIVDFKDFAVFARHWLESY